MRYKKKVLLKDGTECLLRNVEASEADKAYRNFVLTHGETDFLLTYPDENSITIEQERDFLIEKEKSINEIEIGAFVNGHLVGTAGIEAVGSKDKVKHRADMGISIEKAYWRKGIGRALVEVCIECARQAGYRQLELSVVGTNLGAVALYKSVGFVEYGRNPKGFQSRYEGWQELILMRLELNE